MNKTKRKTPGFYSLRHLVKQAAGMTCALIPFPAQQVHRDTRGETWEEVMEKERVERGDPGVSTGPPKLSRGHSKLKKSS